jgi:eukaryotic-like serine/threonine-protein kinase
MSLQRYGEAEDVYHELERQAPDYYYVHWKLGVLHRQLGRADREIREQEIALSLAPEDFRALNDAGLHYANQGDWSRARGYWERAFLVKPDCATCSNVGGVLYFEGRFKEAARYFEYAFEYCDTTTLVVWANLANSLYRVDGEMERSRRMFRRAIELGLKHLEQTPDDLLTVARLADFYSMIGDKENAFRMVDRAVESDESEAMFRVAQVYENFGERTRALHYAGEALRRQYPLHEIMNEPMLKDLTRDPRFTEMVKGEGLTDSRPK